MGLAPVLSLVSNDEDVLPNILECEGCDGCKRPDDVPVVTGTDADDTEPVDAALAIQDQGDEEIEYREPLPKPPSDAVRVGPELGDTEAEEVFVTVPAGLGLAGEVTLVMMVGAELVAAKAVVIPSAPNVNAPVDTWFADAGRS